MANKRSKHDASLNDIGPNDSLDTAQGRVERGECSYRSERDDVDPDLLPNVERLSGHHLIPHHEDDGGDVETCSARSAREKSEDREAASFVRVP